MKMPKNRQGTSGDEDNALDIAMTGVPGLDRMIENGFKRDRITMVGGGPGSGKSILAMQYIVNGIVKFNEPGVFVSFEENKEQVYKDMMRFGWDLANLEKEGKFAFIAHTPEQVGKLVKTGTGIIRDVIDKIKAKRLVIDSLSAFMLLHKNELEKRESSLSLFNAIRKWKCTALVTAQYDISGNVHTSTPMEFEVDNVIWVHNYKRESIRVRAIEVFKMRGTKHSAETYLMQITDNGIVVHFGEKIF